MDELFVTRRLGAGGDFRSCSAREANNRYRQNIDRDLTRKIPDMMMKVVFYILNKRGAKHSWLRGSVAKMMTFVFRVFVFFIPLKSFGKIMKILEIGLCQLRETTALVICSFLFFSLDFISMI